MQVSIKELNFLIQSYNVRLMSENDFNGIYEKRKITNFKIIQLIYCANFKTIPGDKKLFELSENCDRIIVKLN